MSFLDAAYKVWGDETVSPALRAVIGHLIENGVGHRNAVPGDYLVFIAAQKGFTLRKNEIQNRLVVPSRGPEADFFIGSCKKGFFIINSLEDFEVMRKFYEERISAEQKNLATLWVQAAKHGLLPAAQTA